MNIALFKALNIIDCSILRNIDDNQFELLYSKEEWFKQFMPEASDKGAFILSDNSAFLSDFLIDAKSFWARNVDGQLYSGIWTETLGSNHLRLEAIAACEDGERFLIIKNMYLDHQNQQKTLQVARELLMTNDKVQAQHHYMSERLDRVLKQNASLLELNLPIQQAIDNAHLGVIITDKKARAISINEAAWQLFELDQAQHEQSPHTIIQQLFTRQYPESERIYMRHSSWSGELYWNRSPTLHRWLQTEFHPVFDDQRQFKHWVITISDITRIKYLLQSNESLAIHDSLTGLPNRQFFWQTLGEYVESNQTFMLLYVDITGFKKINDLHGHLTGDSLLIDCSKRIKKRLHASDFFARIGADEFAIIITSNRFSEHSENIDDDLLSCSATLADQLISDAKRPIFTDKDQSCILELHIGIAQYPDDGVNGEELMKAADLALHAAKLFAQEPIQFYSQELKEASDKRLAIEHKLRDAIEKNQLTLYLQPIIDMATGKLIKAEALLRWFMPDGQSISPNVFIPIAEQSGLIYPLGKWVISRACEILSELNQKNIDIKISINLSPQQINDPNLLTFVEQMTLSTGVNARHLEFEITEGVFIDNFEKTKQLLQTIRNIGVSIAIDDFGTGFSSLSYLKHLPIDFLKIDQSFISEIDSEDEDRGIVLAILALAKHLHLKVIAEGIETEYQRRFLEQNKCDSGQGYFFARPMPVTEFHQFYHQQNTQKKAP